MFESPTTTQAAPAVVVTHALLWSHSQCALHVEAIAEMLSTNRQAYTEDRRSDYVPIYFGSDDECRLAAGAVRETMRARQLARDQAREALQAAASRAKEGAA